MAVYTEISSHEAAELAAHLDLGQLQTLEGCSGGIENTNYFATTDISDYVLTVFERLSFEQLPYYLHLMKHLAPKASLCPTRARRDRRHFARLEGKPACVVNRLRGKSELAPTPAHCAAGGRHAGPHALGG